jgi:uncharacterized membrane protein YhfC
MLESRSIPLDFSIAMSMAVAALVCIGGPFLIAQLWRKRTGAAWSAFGWGMAVFALFQLVLRLPWQVPLTRWAHAHHEWRIPILAFSALTAGVFEEVGRWAGYRTVLRSERNMRTGVMYGLGHGGIEAILFAGLPIVGLLVGWFLAARGLIPPGRGLDALRRQLGGVRVLDAELAVIERVCAMAAHVGLSLIVLQTFIRHSLGWLLLAVSIHAALDGSVVLAARRLGPWSELLAAVLAALVLLVGVIIATRSRQSWGEEPNNPGTSSSVSSS